MAVGATALVWCAAPSGAQERDRIQTNAGVLQVTVLRSDERGIWYRRGEAELQTVWQQVVAVEAAEPPALRAAFTLSDAARSDAAKAAAAAAALLPIVENFQRLPTPWAEEALLRLIEAQSAAGKQTEAEGWLKKFQTWYPQSPRLLTAVTGLAGGLVASQRYDQAIGLLEAATEAKRKQLTVSDEDGRQLGIALNMLGDCYAQKGDLVRALDCYLETKVLYPHNATAAAVATERAELLKPRVAALVAGAGR